MPKQRTARGLDQKFNQILDEVAKKSINDHMLAQTQRESSHQLLDPRKMVSDPSKKIIKISQEFPVFFKYFRMNEI